MREYHHFIVITDAILNEWHRRRSRFSSTWLTSMFARKQVCRLRTSPIDLSLAIGAARFTDHERGECEKDLHLIDAAIAADRRIASLDEAARNLFRRLAQVADGRQIASIVWVNPERTNESAESWLAAGAPDEASRLLIGTVTSSLDIFR